MRVIAGDFKGRRLKTPAWAGIRPTSDKMRETLFNILAPRIAGARVLDGYAGTGAVGIEALSRGAAHVTFIEQDRRAIRLIESNLTLCGVKRGYTIEYGDVTATLRRMPRKTQFDLVLLDPPYDADPDTVRHALEAAAALATPDGLIVLERSRRRDVDAPDAVQRIRDVVSGDSTLTVFARRVDTSRSSS